MSRGGSDDRVMAERALLSNFLAYLDACGGSLESSQIGDFYIANPLHRESTTNMRNFCLQHPEHFKIHQGRSGNYTIQKVGSPLWDLLTFVQEQGGTVSSERFQGFYSRHPQHRAVIRDMRGFCEDHPKHFVVYQDEPPHWKLTLAPSEDSVVSRLAAFLRTLGRDATSRDLSKFQGANPADSAVIHAHNRTLRVFCSEHSDTFVVRESEGPGIQLALLERFPDQSDAATAAALALFVEEWVGPGKALRVSDIEEFYERHPGAKSCIANWCSLPNFCTQFMGLLSYEHHSAGDCIKLPMHCCFYIRRMCKHWHEHDGFLHRLPGKWTGAVHCSFGKWCSFHWAGIEEQAMAPVPTGPNPSSGSEESELELAKEVLAVHKIRWAQDSVSVRFRSGDLLVDTLKDLVQGCLHPDALPRLHVVKMDKKWYAADGNRRLWVLKEYSRMTNNKLRIRVRALKSMPQSKFTTTCRGKEVQFVGSSRYSSMTFAVFSLKEAPTPEDLVLAEEIQKGAGSVPLATLEQTFQDARRYISQRQCLFSVEEDKVSIAPAVSPKKGKITPGQWIPKEPQAQSSERCMRDEEDASTSPHQVDDAWGRRSPRTQVATLDADEAPEPMRPMTPEPSDDNSKAAASDITVRMYGDKRCALVSWSCGARPEAALAQGKCIISGVELKAVPADTRRLFVAWGPDVDFEQDTIKAYFEERLRKAQNTAEDPSAVSSKSVPRQQPEEDGGCQDDVAPQGPLLETPKQQDADEEEQRSDAQRPGRSEVAVRVYSSKDCALVSFANPAERCAIQEQGECSSIGGVEITRVLPTDRHLFVAWLPGTDLPPTSIKRHFDRRLAALAWDGAGAEALETSLGPAPRQAKRWAASRAGAETAAPQDRGKSATQIKKNDRKEKAEKLADSRHPAEYAQGGVFVRKHSSMGCAIVSLSDARMQNEILSEGSTCTINGVTAEVKAHTVKGAHSHSSADVFVAWGRQAENASPLSTQAIALHFQAKQHAIQAKWAAEKRSESQAADHTLQKLRLVLHQNAQPECQVPFDPCDLRVPLPSAAAASPSGPWSLHWVVEKLPLALQGDLGAALLNEEVQRLVLRAGCQVQLALAEGWQQHDMRKVLGQEDLDHVLVKLRSDLEPLEPLPAILKGSVHRASFVWDGSAISSITFHLARPFLGATPVMNLVLKPSSFLVLGPSSSGKTTMLRHAATVLAERRQVLVVDPSSELGGRCDMNLLGAARRAVPAAMDLTFLRQIIADESPEILITEFASAELAVQAAHLCVDSGVCLLGSLRASLPSLAEAYYRFNLCPQLAACTTFPLAALVVLHRRFDTCEAAPGVFCCARYRLLHVVLPAASLPSTSPWRLRAAVSYRPFGCFGQLLRALGIASNFDDAERGPNVRLTVEGQPEVLVRFSQRGLNTVIIGIWCACSARKCVDWLRRVLYVGGDADTVGAVAGD
ncbi:unnamed protein product [Effrenium voratum]|nr:unnamed protein product [Effrenium voratum]